MKLCFSGFEAPIVIGTTAVSVLEVHNRVLFGRIGASLTSGLGTDAIEPYTLWDDEGRELRPANAFLVVNSPLDLPWADKALVGGLASSLERLVFEDESTRCDVEDAFALLRARIQQVAFQLESDYTFGVDWELRRHLRTYGFGVDLPDDEPLLDKLIKFLALAKDASLKQAILFVNLKLFLSESELERFFEQAFFLQLSIMVLECVSDSASFEHEEKYVVDQDLLESWPKEPAGMTVPPQ